MNNKNTSSLPASDCGIPARKKTLALMVSAVLGTAPAAYSQDQMLEEVIVTATKRRANLQDLPQAITAFNTADIERKGFAVLDDYANNIPSLAFARREPAGIKRGPETVARPTKVATYGRGVQSRINADEEDD